MHLKGTSKFQNTKVTMLLEVEVLLTLFRRNSGVYYPACGPQQYTLDENSGESVKCWDQLDKQGFLLDMGFPSMIRQENEKRDTRIQRNVRISGPTRLQGEGAETESKPALLYFQQWMKEEVGS